MTQPYHANNQTQSYLAGAAKFAAASSKRVGRFTIVGRQAIHFSRGVLKAGNTAVRFG
jgi:hypothetical protein